MKTYLIFAGPTYYPGGGKDDIIGQTKTLEEAKELLKDRGGYSRDWFHVIEVTEDDWKEVW